jgi:competence protein ComEC
VKVFPGEAIMTLFLRLGLLALVTCTVAKAEKLDIFFIDVEGGAATLIVTPKKESILIDNGWRRDDARDAKRIVQVLKEEAGLTQIDFLVVTHFHRDHYGSTLRLSQMVPILNFLDRGPVADIPADPQFRLLYTEYMTANKGDRQTLRAGDEIPVQSGRVPLKMTCLTSSGNIINKPGDANPNCSELKPNKKITMDENALSTALLLTFGKFEFFHGADLTWNIEGELVCPQNRIGRVDAFMVNHHGLRISNNPVLLASISPAVAVIANGEEKGCDPEVLASLRALPGIKGIYQLHKDLKNKPGENVSDDFIANLEPEASCQGHWLRLTVDATTSTYEVTNSRTGKSESYPIR